MTPPPPTKIIAVHLNYRSRAEQRGRTPASPSYFLKPVSSLAGDGDPIVRPQGTELLTFEAEIAVIVGKRARNVTVARAGAHIGWYAPANDVGVYDFRWADQGSNLMAKGQDGFTPIGEPVAAEGLDPAALTLRALVNGEVVQEDSSANLIFPFELPRRRPLALHDARAGRRDPHRDARRIAPRSAGRRGRGRARRALARCGTRSSRRSGRSRSSARSRR